jgi:putative oxidoreductase
MFSKIALVSRILLGLMFTVFGANGLMMVFTGAGFMPMPPQPAVMVTIMTGFAATGYLLGLMFILQFISGVFLLSGFFVNAAIVFLGPILVNILCIHIAVEHSGLPMAIVIWILYLVIIKSRWSDFKQLTKK